MAPHFDGANLERLMTTAFAMSRDDLDLSLAAAVQACVASGASVADVLRRALHTPAGPKGNALRAGFRALARLDRFDDLAALFNGSPRETRTAVIHAFYNFGDATHVGMIRSWLTNEDADISRQAQEAIDAIEQAGTKPKTHRPLALVPSDAEKLLARLMLGQQMATSDAEALATLLSSQGRGIGALARRAYLAADRELLPAIVTALEERVGAGSWLFDEGASVLRDVGDDRAIATLIRALANGSRRQSSGPEAGLAALGHAAAPRLLDAYSRETAIRERAGPLLAKVAGADALGPLAVSLGSPLATVRQSAADGLVLLGKPAVAPLVHRLSSARGDEAADLLEILGRIGARSATGAILSRSDDPDPIVRTAAIRALVPFESSEAAHAIRTAIASMHWTVREAAATVLGSWDWRQHDILDCLNALIVDRHPRVREAAAKTAVKCAGDRSLQAYVTQLLETVKNGSESERDHAARRVDELRGVVAFMIPAPVAAEDFARDPAPIDRLKDEARAVTDLTPYEVLAHAHRQTRYTRRTSATEDLAHAGRPALTNIEMPQAMDDHAHISIIGPAAVAPCQACALDVWLHTGADVDDLVRLARLAQGSDGGVRLRSKGPVPLARGQIVRVALRVPDFGWADEDDVYWAGTLGNAPFTFMVPDGAGAGDHVGHARLSVEGLQIARVSFVVTVGPQSVVARDVTSRTRHITTAFASYAADDRQEVLARVQGMIKVVPALDVFMDVVSLRSGERWEDRLEAEIVNRGVLYLFWSRAASKSTWVDREWRIAYQAKGLAGIDPVPLEAPEAAPPPPELAALHFNEWTLQVRRPGP